MSGPNGPGMLPTILSRAGPLPAVHPDGTQALKPGRIYVAPPDRHLIVRHGYVTLSHGPRENFVRPAVDVLFRSAAIAYGPAAVGVVLTGYLDDGTAGLLPIKDRGGTAIVQDPAEATAASMPRSALRHVKVDHCLKVAEMAEVLVALAEDDPAESGEATADLAVLQLENRIACGIFDPDDWQVLEQSCRPSGLNCPDCRSALYELNDPRLLRYRCRSGHACTGRSLLGAQAEARESQLSALFGAEMEEASLARRMLDLQVDRDDAALASTLRSHLDILGRQQRTSPNGCTPQPGWRSRIRPCFGDDSAESAKATLLDLPQVGMGHGSYRLNSQPGEQSCVPFPSLSLLRPCSSSPFLRFRSRAHLRRGPPRDRGPEPAHDQAPGSAGTSRPGGR